MHARIAVVLGVFVATGGCVNPLESSNFDSNSESNSPRLSPAAQRVHAVYVEAGIPSSSLDYGSIADIAIRYWSEKGHQIRRSYSQDDITLQWIKDWGGDHIGQQYSKLVQVGVGWSNCGAWHEFSVRDVTLITVHELGHALGYSHSSDKSNVMYPTVQQSLVCVTGINHENYACNDNVPVNLRLENIGNLPAENVRIVITGGYRDHVSTVPYMASTRDVSGTIRAYDNCGVPDYYTLIIRVLPENGSGATHSLAIEI